MKKIRSAALLLAVLFCLCAGCGKKEEVGTPAEPEADAAREQEAEAGKSRNPVEQGGETADDADAPDGSEETEDGGVGMRVFALLPEEFFLSSGAGASGTTFTLHEDGTFSGQYFASDMGDSEEASGGTVYESQFTGQFSEPERLDDYAWIMQAESMEYENEPGEEKDDGDVHYIYSEPLGLKAGDRIRIFPEGMPVSELPEEFVGSVSLYFSEGVPETLPFYGLYNENSGESFVGWLPEDGQ